MAAGSRNIIKQLNEDKTLTTSLNLLFPFPTGEYLRVLRNMKDANWNISGAVQFIEPCRLAARLLFTNVHDKATL